MEEKSNLEQLIKELKKYDIQINNRIRLLTLNEKKLAKEIEDRFINNPLAQFIDVQAWLKSYNPELIYIGDDGEYYSGGRYIKCKIIGKKKIMGNDYIELIDLEKNQLMSVSKGSVK